VKKMLNRISIIVFIIIALIYIKWIFFDNTKDSKISFKEIFKNLDYLKTSKNKINMKDLFMFLIFPFIISITSIFILKIRIDFNNSLTLIISIISSILLNFWTILLTARDKIEKEKYKYVINLSTNIVLEIFISIIFIILFIFKELKLDFLNEIISKVNLIKIIKTVYLFLILLYMINFLMILQRIYLISNYEKKDKNND
jgi:putative membrane protein